MADNSTILEKLDGLVARFEEISTLITDPAVIADQKRYVKLTKEYQELDDLMKARKEYIQLLGNIEEAKNITSQIINEIKSVNGTFISLWHNETLSETGIWKGWRSVFEYTLQCIHTTEK